MDDILSYLDQHQSQFEDDLKSFLRIPSISADSRHKTDMQSCAEFVKLQLQQAGCKVEIISTAGHPIVYGEICETANAPTILVYGHYDVQPPDPLDQWKSPPFEPTIREGKIFARGATDDKGQVLTHVKAIQAWMKTVGSLPLNVKFLIEGEEEVGGANLDRFLETHLEQVACDAVVVSDTSQFGQNTPAITYGLRGIISCEILLEGPNQDLHSGVFGGAVANPVTFLGKLVGSLIDNQGVIQIPEFYDDVLPLTEAEQTQFADLPFDYEQFCEGLGIAAGWGESGYSSLERRWARPTCDVNGIQGGYQGEGPKTIIPAKASAKITCRLVPHQKPDHILKSLEQYLRSQTPEGLKLTFHSDHGCPGIVFDPVSQWMSAAKQAIHHGFGQEPVMIREGGSIPVVGTFHELLKVPTLLLGWGRNTDNLHSPNEHFHLEDFHNGIRSSVWLWKELGECQPSRS